jgi:hypothetical protein
VREQLHIRQLAPDIAASGRERSAMPYPVLFFLIFVGAAVGMLIAGAARAARDRADAAAAEEPDRRTWDDTDLYDIE